VKTQACAETRLMKLKYNTVCTAKTPAKCGRFISDSGVCPMFRMVVRRVKKIVAWLLAVVVVLFLASGAWWVWTVV